MNDHTDVLVLSGLGKLQAKHQQLLLDKSASTPRFQMFKKVILVCTNPPDLCQPFTLLHRVELDTLVPELAFLLNARDIDVPPISTELRRRHFTVNSDSDHILGSIMTEVQLVCVVDQGEVAIWQCLHCN